MSQLIFSSHDIDFGIGVFRDPETGDAYMDKDGNFITISGEELLRQDCIVAMATNRGDEAIDVQYGFPIREAMVRMQTIDPETAIKLAIMDTLTPEKIPFLSEIQIMSLFPDHDGVWYVNILIISVNGNSFNMALEVDKLFQSITD